jgi:hypothetical protein
VSKHEPLNLDELQLRIEGSDLKTQSGPGALVMFCLQKSKGGLRRSERKPWLDPVGNKVGCFNAERK